MSGHGGPEPSAWITRFAPLVPAGGSVLDLACGGGRHGRLFLGRNHPVCFLDRDLAGVADLRDTAGAELVAADIEAGPWPLAPGRQFAAIVVTNYLWRPLFPRLIASLQPGGLLLYETFRRGNERHGKPASADFLLAPDELYERLKDCCDILAFEQDTDELPGPGPALRQRICARKR